jgi:hypothetical protein
VKHLEARTLVHIFTEDPYESLQSSATEVDGRKLFNWFLAFEGEYHAKSFGKSTGSRSFAAMAVDYTSYWDNAKAYFYDATFAGNLGDNMGVQPGQGDLLEIGSQQKTETTIATPTGTFSWMSSKFRDAINNGDDLSDAGRICASTNGPG